VPSSSRPALDFPSQDRDEEQKSARSDTSSLIEMLRSVGPKLLAVDGFSQSLSPSSVLVFAHIHCLPSYSKLLGYMIDEIGFDPSAMVVIPKAYSTIPETLHELKAMGIRVEMSNGKLEIGRYNEYAASALKSACGYAAELIDKRRDACRAILLDDGGSLTEFWYKWQLHKKIKTMSVQQTTSGLSRNPTGSKKVMKVNVAGSAAKRWFESHVIAAGITRKLKEIECQLSRSHIGIIGYGAIGRAVANEVARYTKEIRIYDNALNVRSEKFRNTSSLGSLVVKSDYIFGCTGRNCFARSEGLLKHVQSPITFISCSSRDVEFLSLLQAYAPPIDGAFGDIDLQANKLHKVLNGGFPINFDRVREYETEDEISLTRALTLSGVFQCLGKFDYDDEAAIVPLGPKAQKITVETWLRLNQKTHKLFGVSDLNFVDLKWWENESRGHRFLR
jgi:hypothetical protein